MSVCLMYLLLKPPLLAALDEQLCVHASQDDGLGRSPVAHSNSIPHTADGGVPPIGAGGEGKAKLTSLASEAGLPKLDPENEPAAIEDPGEPAEWGCLLYSKWCSRLPTMARVQRGR